jgi:hypothetical protein
MRPLVSFEIIESRESLELHGQIDSALSPVSWLLIRSRRVYHIPSQAIPIAYRADGDEFRDASVCLATFSELGYTVPPPPSR